MWGGNYQCLSFYHHDIVCSLEANCLRKMGLSSFFILSQKNHKNKAGLFLELSGQIINNQVSNGERPPKQTHHGLGNMNPHHFGDAVLRKTCFVLPMFHFQLICYDSFELTRDNGQLLNTSISLHSLKWGLQELDVLRVSCFLADSGGWLVWKVE